MTDHSLIFQAPMIRALLEGRKTQTRRLLKERPERRGISAGDRVWVRENWRTAAEYDSWPPRDLADNDPILFPADGVRWQGSRITNWGKVRPSIHLPRQFSRMTLVIADVDIQRLQDITEADALAEGVEYETADPPFFYVPGIEPHSHTAVGVEEPDRPRAAARCYGKLIDHINGAGTWASNPWIVAYTFTVEKRNIDK